MRKFNKFNATGTALLIAASFVILGFASLTAQSQQRTTQPAPATQQQRQTLPAASQASPVQSKAAATTNTNTNNANPQNNKTGTKTTDSKRDEPKAQSQVQKMAQAGKAKKACQAECVKQCTASGNFPGAFVCPNYNSCVAKC